MPKAVYAHPTVFENFHVEASIRAGWNVRDTLEDCPFELKKLFVGREVDIQS